MAAGSLTRSTTHAFVMRRQRMTWTVGQGKAPWKDGRGGGLPHPVFRPVCLVACSPVLVQDAVAHYRPCSEAS